MGNNYAEIEKASIISSLEEGGFTLRKQLTGQQKAIMRQRQVKGLGLTIFGLLAITSMFLMLSYTYEPMEGIKGQPIARFLQSGPKSLIHFNWS